MKKKAQEDTAMTINNTVRNHLGNTNVIKVTTGEHEGADVVRITTAGNDVFVVEIGNNAVTVNCQTNAFYFTMATTADKKTVLFIEALKAITAYI